MESEMTSLGLSKRDAPGGARKSKYIRPPWHMKGILLTITLVSVGVGLVRASGSADASFLAGAGVIAGITFIGLLLIVGGVCGYFFPTYMAYHNHKPVAGVIFVLNLFFGWTLIGWMLLGAWGCMPERE